MPDAFYIASLKRTARRDPYVTFWRPEALGYAWPLPWAGVYGPAEAARYNDGEHSIAVDAEAVRALGEAPEARMVDGDVGPVVRNGETQWRALFAARLPKGAAHGA